MKNPFKTLFSRKQPPVKRTKTAVSAVSWPIPEGSFLEYILNGTGSITANQAMEYYRKSSAIATAVDKIAGKVEQITPVLEGRDGKLISDHEVLRLLTNPNPFESWTGFIGKLSRHYLLTHDSHLSLIGNIRRPPLELYAIKPQNVSVTSANDSYPASYLITSGPCKGNYARELDKDRARFVYNELQELTHIMGFSSRSDDTVADSPLEAAALEARQLIKGRYHNLALLDNGGRLSLIVAFKDADGMDDDEHATRKQRINEDLAGEQNAGGIAVISGEEVEIKEVGKSNKDMDFSELDKTASQAIYLRYEVPLPLVTTEASTYNNIENALLDFYENTVLPFTDFLFEGVQKAVFPRYNNSLEGYRLTYDPESINILIRQKLDEIKKRRDINIETTNELRALLPHREAVEGGDVLYQNATLVPVGTDLFTEDEVSVEELGGRRARSAGAQNPDENDDNE